MILDTNAVSAVLAGDPALERVLAVSDQHHVPVIVVGEYSFGLMASRERRVLGGLFQQLIDESILLCPDRETADQYAAIRYDLKKKGTPIPENDVWIAALAKQHGLDIVSRDPHFDNVEGVRRLTW